MSEVVIRAEGLGKQYRIGRALHEYRTLRDVIADITWAAVRAFQSVWSGNGISRASDDSFWALKNVSFEVQRGKVIGIIGRNGAGKTTLLKILSRITEPTEGYAEIRGRVGSLLEVGTGFHPELTGRENIYLNGAILGMKRREIVQKFDEIVGFAEVERFVDTPVKHYSSGMYLRLAFAVAAYLDPEILLVDEVLAVGDAAFQRKCLEKMEKVATEGRTVLFVSHSMKAISNLTEKCFWIDNGRIAASGETNWVIGQYLSHLDNVSASDGWADLSRVERTANPWRKAQFDWVRTLDSGERQTGTFLEGDPITIELGFRVSEMIKNVQLGCSVGSVDASTWLFTVPSPVFRTTLGPGSYSVRMHIRPNHLRRGDYTLALKLFADGRRHDRIRQMVKLRVEGYLSNRDDSTYLQKWVAGYLRFDYDWTSITPVEDS